MPSPPRPETPSQRLDASVGLRAMRLRSLLALNVWDSRRWICEGLATWAKREARCAWGLRGRDLEAAELCRVERLGLWWHFEAREVPTLVGVSLPSTEAPAS